jgi:hypothetical protein
MIVSAKHAMFFLGDFGPGARPGAEPGGPIPTVVLFLFVRTGRTPCYVDELRAHFWWLRYI